MATKILLKKSSTTGGTPLTSDLDQGELAINLADRKVFTKDNGNAIVTLNGAYVDSTAPATPAEGDLWYDTGNNALKAHNGSSFVATGVASFAALSDTTVSAAADGEIVRYNGSAFINNTLAEADIQPASTAVATARTSISVTDAGGDGSAAYDNSTGVITYTGPSAAEVRAHHSAGTGVGIASGAISIGQAVATSDSVTFAGVTTNSVNHTGGITINPNSGGAANEGTVIIAGNLTVNGATTSVNSNEVNIGDSIIVLNADETGVPSQNGGIEIERGSAANKTFIWNETDDAWDLSGETLQGVIIDGGSY
jgi:co-chaperonin GroES (HSP10)